MKKTGSSDLFDAAYRSLVNCIHKYCKTLNACMPFISRISRTKQNCEIEGREHQLQAKNRTKLLQYFKLYGFNSPKYTVRGQINFACEVANFQGRQIKGFYSSRWSLDSIISSQKKLAALERWEFPLKKPNIIAHTPANVQAVTSEHHRLAATKQYMGLCQQEALAYVVYWQSL